MAQGSDMAQVNAEKDYKWPGETPADLVEVPEIAGAIKDSTTHAYISRITQREPNLFLEEYYSSTDTKIYFDDEEQREIGYIQYSVQEQLKPIYGYASRTWDEVAIGNRIVTGVIKTPIRNIEARKYGKEFTNPSFVPIVSSSSEEFFDIEYYNEAEQENLAQKPWTSSSNISSSIVSESSPVSGQNEVDINHTNVSTNHVFDTNDPNDALSDAYKTGDNSWIDLNRIKCYLNYLGYNSSDMRENIINFQNSLPKVDKAQEYTWDDFEITWNDYGKLTTNTAKAIEFIFQNECQTTYGVGKILPKDTIVQYKDDNGAWHDKKITYTNGLKVYVVDKITDNEGRTYELIVPQKPDLNQQATEFFPGWVCIDENNKDNTETVQEEEIFTFTDSNDPRDALSSKYVPNEDEVIVPRNYKYLLRYLGYWNDDMRDSIKNFQDDAEKNYGYSKYDEDYGKLNWSTAINIRAIFKDIFKDTVKELKKDTTIHYRDKFYDDSTQWLSGSLTSDSTVYVVDKVVDSEGRTWEVVIPKNLNDNPEKQYMHWPAMILADETKEDNL